MPYVTINSESTYIHSNKLISFYEENVVEIARLLGREECNIPRSITLHLVEGTGGRANYSRQEKRITYEVAPNGSVLVDMGRLIHEAVHVVQDYSFNSNRNRVTKCWTEGIADYCRAKLDDDFNIEEGQMADPDLVCKPEASKASACFLIWLSKHSPNVVVDLNDFLAKNGHMINDNDDIFANLKGVKEQYRKLKIDYFLARKKIHG